MTITIQAAGGSEVTLIDGPDRAQDKTCGPAEMTGGMPLSPQVRLPLRRPAARPIARGGATANGSFGGARLCADAAAAAAWIVTHLAACPRGGTLRFKVAGATKLTIADTVIADIPYSLHGATVKIAYNYVGGAVS